MPADSPKSHEATPIADSPPQTGLPHFHFGLKQLLVVVTLISVLMAVLATFHGPMALALLIVVLVAIMHLFGTALGAQLRAHTDRNYPRRLSEQETVAQVAPGQPAASTLPRSPWHERRSTPLPWLVRFIVLAMVAGGLLGMVLLRSQLSDQASLASVVVGACSISVVVGWLAFLAYSFVGVFRHGLRNATEADRVISKPRKES